MVGQMMNMAIGTSLIETGLFDVVTGVFELFLWSIFFISAIQAFFGYILLRIWIVLNGIIVGMVTGGILGFWIGVLLGGGFSGTMVSWIIIGMIIGAIAGGYIAYKFWKIGVFLVCFVACMLVGMLLFGLMFQSMSVGRLLGFVLGCIGGYYGVKYVKPVIILITSISNGTSAGLALVPISPVLGIVGIIACVGGGFYVQCRMNGNVFGIGTGRFSFKEEFQLDHTQEIDAPKVHMKEENTTEKLESIKKEMNSFTMKKNSKIRRDLTSRTIRVRNEREYCFSNAPIVIPQIQIADINEEGKIGLYVSLQNIVSEKRIIAFYCDIICYNVLKEKMNELKNMSILDLSIETGQVVAIEKPIWLPDSSIRKCEIIPRHIVFSDDTIWSYEGEDTFFCAPMQKEFIFTDPKLKSEFTALIYEKTRLRGINYQYQPMIFEEFWYCGCGQLNVEKSCVCCGLKKNDIFEMMDLHYLQMVCEEKVALQEAERLERKIARKKKMEELQAQTKQAVEHVSEKGREVLVKSNEVGRKTVDSLKEQMVETKQKVAIRKEKKREELQNGDVRYCSECGAEYEIGDCFCSQCGAEVHNDEIEGKVCLTCHTQNTMDSKFCMQCGKLL